MRKREITVFSKGKKNSELKGDLEKNIQSTHIVGPFLVLPAGSWLACRI